jgi:hypothetical protein
VPAPITAIFFIDLIIYLKKGKCEENTFFLNNCIKQDLQ